MKENDDCLNNNDPLKANASNYIQPVEAVIVQDQNSRNNEQEKKDDNQKSIQENNDINHELNKKVESDSNDKELMNRPVIPSESNLLYDDLPQEQLKPQIAEGGSNGINTPKEIENKQKKPKSDFLITGVDIEVKPKTDKQNENNKDIELISPIKHIFEKDKEGFLRNKLDKLAIPPELMKGASSTVDQTLLQIKEEINAEVLQISNNQKKLSELFHVSSENNKKDISPLAIKTLNKLKKSQEAIKNNIFALKRNQKLLENESFLNVSGSVIVDTIRQSHLKKITEKKRLLLDQLEGIQSQVERVLGEERKVDRNTLIKCFLENFESDDAYEQKAIEYEKQHLMRQEKMLNEINSAQERRQREFDESEKRKIEKKERYLIELKVREKEAISKRRKDIEEKMQKTKNYININSQKKENDYLFFKMRNTYEQQEKKLFDKIKLTKRNKIVSKEEIMELNRRLEEQRNKLSLDSKEKTALMKEMWKNRSQVIPDYKSPIDKIIVEEKIHQNEEEELNKMKPVIIAKERKDFGERRVHIPLANEKLKKERESRIVRIEKKGKQKRRLQRKVLVQVPMPQPKKKAMLKSNSAVEVNSNGLSHTILTKPKRYIKSPKGLLSKPDKPPNYLLELKQSRQAKPMNRTDWTKVAQNPKGTTIQNIQVIKALSDVIEEKVNNKKALLRINGGYEKNQEVGDALSDLLCQSIRAKLAIIHTLKPKAN